jgi:esterase/lipase superfamily enzyme
MHLIAHSMGSEVLGHAMLKLGVHKLGPSERGSRNASRSSARSSLLHPT